MNQKSVKTEPALLLSCPNCSTELHGRFCSNCGQNQKNIARFLLDLGEEYFGEFFSLDSRIWRTLSTLLLKPGQMTRDYFDGKRARYIPPLRLYLVLSFIFFLVISVFNFEPDSSDVNLSQATVTGAEIDNSKTEQTEPEANESLAELEEDLAEELEASGLQINEKDAETLIVETLAPLGSSVQGQISQQLTKARAAIGDDPSALGEAVLDIMPPVVFFLLPVFAIFLKLAYLRQSVFYTEHFVLTLNNHSFLWLLLPISELLEYFGTFANIIGVLLIPYMAYYLYRSMRVFYGQSRSITLIKYVLLGVAYLTLMLLGAVFALVLGVLTL